MARGTYDDLTPWAEASELVGGPHSSAGDAHEDARDRHDPDDDDDDEDDDDDGEDGEDGENGEDIRATDSEENLFVLLDPGDTPLPQPKPASLRVSAPPPERAPAAEETGAFDRGGLSAYEDIVADLSGGYDASFGGASERDDDDDRPSAALPPISAPRSGPLPPVPPPPTPPRPSSRASGGTSSPLAPFDPSLDDDPFGVPPTADTSASGAVRPWSTGKLTETFSDPIPSFGAVRRHDPAGEEDELEEMIARGPTSADRAARTSDPGFETPERFRSTRVPPQPPASAANAVGRALVILGILGFAVGGGLIGRRYIASTDADGERAAAARPDGASPPPAAGAPLATPAPAPEPVAPPALPEVTSPRPVPSIPTATGPSTPEPGSESAAPLLPVGPAPVPPAPATAPATAAPATAPDRAPAAAPATMDWARVSASRLAQRLLNQRVRVLLLNGEEIEGRFLEVKAERVAIGLDAGLMRLPLAEIADIRFRDGRSAWDLALLEREEAPPLPLDPTTDAERLRRELQGPR